MAERFPLELIELDAPVVEHFESYLPVCARELAAVLHEEPDDMGASERSDGGLWISGGHSRYWTIYGVPRGRWGYATDSRGGAS